MRFLAALGMTKEGWSCRAPQERVVSPAQPASWFNNEKQNGTLKSLCRAAGALCRREAALWFNTPRAEA
jgi:hypothetical protein